MDRDEFVAEFGGVFEESPWIAREAWEQRPFGSVDALHAAMVAVVRAAPRERRLALYAPSVLILTLAIWVLALVTHGGARYAGTAWLAAGLVVFVAVRRSARRGLLERVLPIEELPPGAEFKRILVPMKMGDIGEEMVATAIALAKDSGAEVQAVTVVRVPRRYALDGHGLPPDVADRVAASMEEARLLGEDHGVEVRTEVLRARSIGHAIVEEAVKRDVDVIVLGSSPRWRRQSRFFSPTVDFVLRRAPCEVLVVAFPEGVFEA
jgi:nucleotide-binding universal stress UspA family protein